MVDNDPSPFGLPAYDPYNPLAALRDPYLNDHVSITVLDKAGEPVRNVMPYRPGREQRVNSSLRRQDAPQWPPTTTPPVDKSAEAAAAASRAAQLQAERDRIDRDNRNSRDRARRMRNRQLLIHREGARTFRGRKPRGA